MHQRDVVIFALATGLRQSNVVGLKWSNVRLETGHAWVGADQSKNRKPIAVPLNATAQEVLRRQLGRHRERVFTYAGKPLGWANTKAWREALKRASIENFRWHDLRHTWASWHRQSGYADARAAAVGWLAFVGDGRALRTSRAGPSREGGEPVGFGARWLRFSYAAQGIGACLSH